MPWWRRALRLDPATVFTWVALLVGAPLVALTPPFQVPDEPNHFYRAYQVAEGGLVPRTTSTRSAACCHGAFRRSLVDVMGDVPFNPEVKQDFKAWSRAFEMPLRPDDRIETPFPNTALSGPIAYLPQALGIDFARIVGASALSWCSTGDALSTLLLCVAVTAVAIRWLPIRQWTCVLLSLLPMTVFVRSSLSSDGPTLALTMLSLAICLKPVDLTVPSIDPKGRRRLFSIAALLPLGKPPVRDGHIPGHGDARALSWWEEALSVHDAGARGDHHRHAGDVGARTAWQDGSLGARRRSASAAEIPDRRTGECGELSREGLSSQLSRD